MHFCPVYAQELRFMGRKVRLINDREDFVVITCYLV
jgi:hypothetical protein